MCLHPIDFCSIVHNSQINGGGKKSESALYLICFYWRRAHLSWRTWNLISFKRLLRILQLLCLLALGAKLYNSMFAKTILDTKSNSQKPSHRNIHLISLLPQSPQDHELLQGKIYIYIIKTLLLSLSVIATLLNISQIYIKVPNPFFSSWFSGCVQEVFWEQQCVAPWY